MNGTKKGVWIVVAIFGIVAALFWYASFNGAYEKVVTFSYARTRPCNVDYYNYEFSIRPLLDLMHAWNGDKDCSGSDFRTRVKRRLLTSSGFEKLSLTEQELDEVFGKVKFLVDTGHPASCPIQCKMFVRAKDRMSADLIARGFAESMLAGIEEENIAMAWKSTMGKGIEFQRRDRELARLKRRLSDSELPDEVREQLSAESDAVARARDRAKSEWDSAIAVYREKWDASLVFDDAGFKRMPSTGR